MILLDTNVVSEALKPVPTSAVIDWLDIHFTDCAISSLVVFELHAGAAMLEPGKRRDTLERAVARAVRRFGPRIYPFDAAAAEAAARLVRVARTAGLGIHQIPAKLADLQTAGIAVAHGLQLATRNIRDFDGLGLDLVDPWNVGQS
jgi:predicted nucleic acid-binding protein